MPHRKYISLILSPEGGQKSLSFRLQKWQLWTVTLTIVLGWLFLFLGILGAVFFARFAANERALIAENNRLRMALVKADSLRQELDKMRAMRKLMEKALLVAKRKEEGLKLDSDENFPDWLSRGSVFNGASSLPELTKYLEDIKRAEAYIPSGLPAQGVITAKFGETGGIFRSPHSGVDILAQIGTPVRATADGIVSKVDEDSELGRFVEIDHLNGYRTIYAHLSDFSVERGSPIRRGSIIGHSGKTGKARNPHIHHEVLYAGKPIDPLKKITSPKYTTADSGK